MTTMFVDGFDIYGDVGGSAAGTAVGNMLNGVYAEVSHIGAGIGAPSWGARTGSYCYFNSDDPSGARYVLPSQKTNFLISLGYSISFLPEGNNQFEIVSFRDDANAMQAKLVVESTGSLSLYNNTGTFGTLVASSDGPVVTPATWYHMEMQYQSDGDFELRVNGVTVISGTFSYGANEIAQVAFIVGPNILGTLPTQYLDDLIIRDTGGTVNNGFEGDLRVATIFPIADTAIDGWTPNPRHLWGSGVLDLSNNTSILSAFAPSLVLGSPTTLHLGTADFTLESWVRISALPTAGNISHIMGLWQNTDGDRSYQFYLDAVTGGNLNFQISTDGTAAGIESIIAWPWIPETDTWYHVAVSRASGETMLFINGVQQGLPVADTFDYYTSTGLFQIGGVNTSGAGVESWWDGWMDETRITAGFARYTTDFAVPTGPFPRGSVDDPEWADVAYIAGYNGGISDESSFNRAVTANNGAAYNIPNDADGSYQMVNKSTPADDTFIEAPLLPATNIYTLTSQPSDGETVTVGTKDGTIAAVYTFKNALTTAYQIKIGASLHTTLANLTAGINAGAGSGTAYGTGTVANFDVFATQLPIEQIEVIAEIAGTGGNSIASTTTAADGSWTTATLTGGTDIPGPSAFSLGRPPNNTTIIKSVTIFTRQNKTDSGTCVTQTALIGPADTVLEATNTHNPSTTSSYFYDHYETDPDTSGDITVTTVVSAKVQINRTA